MAHELGRTWLGEPPIYLGDGVYATFDGLHIWLKTERGAGAATVTHAIALDHGVFEALLKYQQELSPRGKRGSGA